jgi:hypothetical protein
LKSISRNLTLRAKEDLFLVMLKSTENSSNRLISQRIEKILTLTSSLTKLRTRNSFRLGLPKRTRGKQNMKLSLETPILLRKVSAAVKSFRKRLKTFFSQMNCKIRII